MSVVDFLLVGPCVLHFLFYSLTGPDLVSRADTVGAIEEPGFLLASPGLSPPDALHLPCALSGRTSALKRAGFLYSCKFWTKVFSYLSAPNAGTS